MKTYLNTIISLEAQYLYRQGLEMINQQKENTALVYLRQAVFIAPGFSKAYRELGNCLARLDRQEEASAYYLKASRIDSMQNETMVKPSPGVGRSEKQSVPGYSQSSLIC